MGSLYGCQQRVPVGGDCWDSALFDDACALQCTRYLLELGKFHRHSGIPNDYFGVMGTIFVHSVSPYWDEAGCLSEETEEVWMMLFAHIARDDQ